MRIAIITESFPSRSETFIYSKVEKMVARGHEHIIFCNRKNELLMTELFPDTTGITVKVFNKKSILLFGLLHPVLLIRAALTKKNIAKELFRIFRVRSINGAKAAIVHFEFSGIAVNYLSTIKDLNGRIMVSCRGTGEKLKLLVYEERREKLRQVFALADSIHCVSHDISNIILPLTDKPEKIFVNFPSIDTEYFRNDKCQNHYGEKIILSVGRLSFAKGYATGLLAIALLKQKGLKFKWIIAGSGNDYEQIFFQIHTMQLQDVVILAGSKSRVEVKQLMQEADIFFLPSIYEGIANVVLEAMSMQLPVVSSRAGGMAEVITHEENALLANIYDHESMAVNLMRLMNDEQLCSYLGNKARERINGCFKLEMQINKFEDMYMQLVSH